MEFGIYSFGDFDPEGGLTPAQRMAALIEEIELADQVGLDVYALGEHHRADFLVSAPAVALAAAARTTKKIRLGSAVTVLSSDDPVRVFQQFSTLDLISDGRAEIMAGRGSFVESFPLFGLDLDDYEELFTEKLDLLLRLVSEESVTWSGSGKFRAPLENVVVYPRPVQNPLPVSIAIGGSPESAARAGQLGLPLDLAIIGGLPERFRPLIDLYRESGKRAGHDASKLRVHINQHGLIAQTSEQAASLAWPPHQKMMDKIGKERGWPPQGRMHYDAGRHLRGHLAIGSPAEIVDKILFENEMFQMDRFNLQFIAGNLPHAHVLKSIELFGTHVAPEVKKALAE